MAAIVETLYSDKRLVLANEEVIRPIPFGNNWTSIRIGIRFAVYGGSFGSSPTAITFGATSGLTLGVCLGPCGWHCNTPEDYLGLRMATSGTTWTNSAWNTVPNYYTSSANTHTLLRKTRAGVLTNTGAAMNTMLISSVPGTIRNVLYVGIVKGSTITMAVHSCTTAGQVQADRSRGDFLYNMGVTAPAILTNPSASTFTYGSGAMTFDHVAVGWNKFYPFIEICDIAVMRFY